MGTPLLWTFTIPDAIWPHVRGQWADSFSVADRASAFEADWFRQLLRGQSSWMELTGW